jgi:hypothetical protein
LVRLGHWRTVVRRARHRVSAQRLRSAKGRDQPSATTFGGAVTYVGRARLQVRRRSEASQLLDWAIYPRLRCGVNARIGPFVLFFTKPQSFEVVRNSRFTAHYERAGLHMCAVQPPEQGLVTRILRR